MLVFQRYPRKLSSTTTKHELTVYLAKKAHHHFEGKPKIFIVTSRQQNYTFSHLMQMCLSSQLDATINSEHTSSLV